MAVEEKQGKKTDAAWSNPFSGRYEPFVDEKGFGKFHLFNLSSTKQINFDNNRSPGSLSRELITGDPDSVVGDSTTTFSSGIKSSQDQISKKSQDTSSIMKDIEEYKKLLTPEAAVTINTLQDESGTVDPNDPLASLIKQINQLQQQRRAIEGEIITPHSSTPLGNKPTSELELLEKLISESKENNSTEPCPNVNPFPLASLLQPQPTSFSKATLQSSFTSLQSSSLQSNSLQNSLQNTLLNQQKFVPGEASDSQKQLLQQRLIDRIKGAMSVSQPGAVTTITNSPYISPIPAVRLEPSPKTGLQMKDVGGGATTPLDNDNVRLLRLLIPNFSGSGGSAPPNYTAVPVNKVAPVTPVASSFSSNGTVPTIHPNQQQKAKQGVIMDNEKCLEMFQNIKKQISDQGVFNLTATIHQTSNESEGLILVVTRNKIDIHPQFGPIHVARVVITNKLYYKFFVLDKVVNSGPVGAKEISEVFWKLSEVSQHILCPGFNQRYISKVESNLSEKVEDITSSYCRLTAKLCTVWHQRDSKPGQSRNYHTRDLCCECLDLYHKLQFKVYSHAKLKQQHGWTASPAQSKREQEQVNPTNHLSKKPKLNGQQYAPPSAPIINSSSGLSSATTTALISGLSSTAQVLIPTSPGLIPTAPGLISAASGLIAAPIGMSAPTGMSSSSSSSALGMTEQQLKAVLSNLVANSRVVQVNKEAEGDDLVDICGEDSSSEASHLGSSHLAASHPNISNMYTPNDHPSTLSNEPIANITYSTSPSNPPYLISGNIPLQPSASIPSTNLSYLSRVLPTQSQALSPAANLRITSTTGGSEQPTNTVVSSSGAVEGVASVGITSAGIPAFSHLSDIVSTGTSHIIGNSESVLSSSGIAPANACAETRGDSPNLTDVLPVRSVTPVSNSPDASHGSKALSTDKSAGSNSKIDEILASLNELQKNVPELIGSDSTATVDEGIRNLLKQFQSSDPSQPLSEEQQRDEDSSLGDPTGEDMLVIQED